jgi:hypothetical protein
MGRVPTQLSPLEGATLVHWTQQAVPSSTSRVIKGVGTFRCLHLNDGKAYPCHVLERLFGKEN